MFTIIQILIGIILADLISGALHYIQDHSKPNNIPIFGDVVAAGISHHENPQKFINSTIWGRSKHAIIGATFAFIICSVVFGFQLWLIVACLFGAAMIEIQVFAHRADNPKWVVILQKIGLFQNPSQHAGHHVENGQTWCVITSWCNPFIDYLLKRIDRL